MQLWEEVVGDGVTPAFTLENTPSSTVFISHYKLVCK